MKKSINLWVSPPGMELDKLLDIVKDAGYEAVEPNLAEDGYLATGSPDKEIEALRKKIEGKKLEISGVSTGLMWKYPLTASDVSIRTKGEKTVEKLLRSAAILGADGVLVVPGVVQADWAGTNEIVPYDIAYERSKESLKKLLPLAEKLKVSICVENVWNKFLLSPLEMKRFVEELDSPYAGVYFDVGNVLKDGFPEMWIRILKKLIKKIHLKDFRTDIGNINGFCKLLEGNVNWPEVIKALKETGYDGYLTVEELSPYNHYPETVIYHTSLSVDKILGRK